MEIIYTNKAKNDIDYWKKSGNKLVQKRIQELIFDIEKNPLIGLGKPEQLKFELSGKWSRRINQEHRIVYDIKETVVTIHSLRGHYNKKKK